MSTPLPVNARLTFQVQTGSTSIDELGNPSATTEDLIVLAYLKEGKNRSTSSGALDGGELSRIYLEGRIAAKLVGELEEDLAELPASILPGARAIAFIDRAGSNITGDFFLEASIPSAFGVDAVLGGKIRGYLVTEVAWGEAL